MEAGKIDRERESAKRLVKRKIKIIIILNNNVKNKN